jgi:translation initiation factor IF-1
MAEIGKDDLTIQGEVTEALPGAMFRVELSDGQIIIAYLAGKMRLHRIKVLVGDKVLVLLDSYGGKGRIIKRL